MKIFRFFILVCALGLALTSSVRLNEAGASPVESFFKSYESTDYSQFGYDVLASGQTLNPNQVGPDYVIGPQDIIQVNVWGGTINEMEKLVGGANEKNYNDYTLTVDAGGSIIFPEIGRLTVNGLTLYELRQIVAKKYRDYYRNCTTSVSIEKPRTIQILVSGKVNKPGYTSVIAGSSLFDVLLAAGGVSKAGSLRSVVIKRSNGREEVVDLYQFIVSGRMNTMPKMNFKDSIYVKQIGPVVLLKGRITQPGIYEMKKGETLTDLITFAGNVLPDCEKHHIEITRFVDGSRKILNIDVSKGAVDVLNGDTVTFLMQSTLIKDAVTLRGDVFVQKTFAWHKDFFLKDIVKDITMFKPETSLEYAEILRYNESSLEKTIISFCPANILESKARDSEDALIQLKPYDEVVFYSKTELKERPMVSISGGVRKPGKYNWMEKMTLKNLIRTAGGIPSQAYDEGKIVRYVYTDRKWATSSMDFSLSQINQKDSSDIELQPLDRVIINQKSDFFQTDWKVTVNGEVNYPGSYPIGGKTRLSQAIEYAGMLKENADLGGLVLVRGEAKSLQTKHQKAAEDLLKKDMLKISSEVRDAYLSTEERLDNKQAVAVIQEYLSRVENKEIQGRILLREEDLKSFETFKNSPSDVFLNDDDVIAIPEKKNMVTLVGEVYIPSSFLYQEDYSLSDYLEKAGGVSEYADFESAYIIRTNGTVVSYAQKGGRLKSMAMLPGDVVIIPSKVLGGARK